MKLLLAVDGSEYSEGAARFLTFLDLSPDDEIIVFHSIHWSHFLYNGQSYREAVEEVKRLFAARVLDSVLKILKPLKARIATVIVEGSARQAIIEKAVESDTDLIVMGARGKKGVQSLLGSVTAAVTVKSPTPVLVTKLPLSVTSGGMRILFATDGSDFSISTQKLLCSIPFHYAAELTICNVAQPFSTDLPLTFVPELNERFMEAIEEAVDAESAKSNAIADQAREYLSKRFAHVTVSLAEGDPSTEILAAADALRADLIAIGCRGLTGISGMAGSVSRNVLMHSKCPVLIGKVCK